MKKYLIIFVMVFTSVVLFSCGSSSSRTSTVKKVMESKANPSAQAAPSAISNGSDMKRTTPSPQASNAKVSRVDVDLTQYTSTVADSLLIQLRENKEKSRGLVVKAKGEYNYYKNPITNKEYYNCVFASTCCPNGLEFILADPTKYPAENGEPITIIGEFDYYDEEGAIYLNLVNATIV